MQQNPVLVIRYRDLVAESFHRGVVCILDRDRNVKFSAGDIMQICYPRSAMKPFQMLPLVETGTADHFGFSDKELAIMCGSHNGEDEHVDVVEGILKKIGLSPDDLRCGPQYPTLQTDRNELICSKEPAKDIHNNCSGKHSGFLAMCVHLGHDTEHYLNPKHPVQQLILKAVEEMYEYPREKMTIGIDGCSAPIYAMPVYNQALGYLNLVAPDHFGPDRRKACARILKAMTENPQMVAGAHRYCTDVMLATRGRIVAKTGADGVFSMGFLEEGLGVAIKIDDGLMGPQYAVAQKILEASGLFSDATLSPVRHYMEDPITNWNKIQTGRSMVSEEVFMDFVMG